MRRLGGRGVARVGIRRTAGATLLATVVIAGAAGPAAAPPAGRCRPSPEVALLAVPPAAAPGTAVRVLAVAPGPREAVLTLETAGGRVLARSDVRHGLTPSWWLVEAVAPAGAARARLASAGAAAGADPDGACAALGAAAAVRPRATTGAWPLARGWDHRMELVYSAWVEHLFDDPLDAEPSWHGLDPILDDPARNLLHDSLGRGEDDGARLRLEPDCADLPYFLRAYFAWKLGLPFGYSQCTRGGHGVPPRCGAWHSSRDPLAGAPADPVERVGAFLRREVGSAIHSGSARTAGDAERGDLYPTRLAPASIRPGTVYADPYGHTLVVVQRLPQTADRGGILLAVDAQPDGSIARKRYWRGNFLFATDPALGGAGFKHFRPIVHDGGALRPLSNRAIAADPDYGDFSLEQYAGGVEDFYDRMDALLSPAPMDPERALRETIEALDEQVRTRVQSVANGETWMAAHPGTIAMPEGAEIFETTGPWEDYATPSRDLRLLIAIDVVRDFPARVARRPERYAVPAGTTVAALRARLDGVIRDETAARRFAYARSDGSPWTLTLADVLGRTTALETAYDPNDCVEVRWGAPADGAEASTCRRRAPAAQRARMDAYRVWFHERRRPPRE
jgi:hypothetical protein